jgi:SIR2-like protein
VSDDDRRGAPWKGGLHKVHGCALQPSSLVVSSSDLANLSNWVSCAVGTEIGYQVVAFVGIATVADYVGDRVEAVLKEMDDDKEHAFVVEPNGVLGDSWSEILRPVEKDRHIPCTAEEFFERLLRGLLVLVLSKASLEANNLNPPVASVQNALSIFCADLQEQESSSVIRWWTDGTDSPLRRNGALKTARAHQQVLAVAALLGDDSPGLKAVDEVLTVELPDCYVELASVDGGKGKDLKRRQIARLRDREKRGAFPKLVKPVLVLHDGSTSPVEPGRPRDVLAEGHTDDLVEGADQNRFCFRPVQTVLDRRPDRTELLAA